MKIILEGKYQKNDEWYTNQETVDLVTDLLNPKGTICCPFDSEESYFVKKAKLIGDCIYGITDYLDKDYQYDYLMTNPPFSIKDKVIERVLQAGKPSALVLPITTLGGVKRHSLFAKYGYPAVYIPSKRINYYDHNWVKRESNYFHTIIMLFNTEKEGLIWESKN